ncbi:MAG: galactokinase [Clostridiales bacterium]|nr:galactokinase [Clostridiales bacterium]
MLLMEEKKAVESGGYDGDFRLLYGETEQAARRYAAACDEFAAIFGDQREVRFFSAPGRTEVGGNHTDHQRGRVLAGSVNLDVIAVVSPNDESVVRIQSAGFPMDTVSLADLSAQKEEEGRAASLIRGMCARMAELGYRVQGFDAYTTSNVLKGSGLSSSAAFEVLIGVIISAFSGGAADPVEIAQAAQYAENVYFGKPCGLMDQMASSVGGFTAIDFADPKNPVIEKVDFDFAHSGYKLCIVDTGGNHADLTGDYADITAEMKAVAGLFGKQFLREVEESDFYGNIARVKRECGDRSALRAAHFFADNRRAAEERDALKSGDFAGFLRLVNASGRSSYMYLQNVFSTSAPTEQGLSLALCLTERYLDGRGAFRVHGGGFAGTIQAFVPEAVLEGYRQIMDSVFGEGACHVLDIRPVGGYPLKGA